MPTAAAISRKRKTTEETDTSPPKRQTRARAAKATDDTTTTKPKTTRITTASARIAAEARAASVKTAPKSEAKTTKRKTRADNAEAKEEPASRIRTSRPVVEKPEVKPRTRAVKTKPEEKPAEPKQTRVRKTKVEPKPEEPVVKRSTRTRSATMESGIVPEVEPIVKKVVKRVTFQEDLIQDKENKPIPELKKKESAKKESAKTTGIKARPVRKPTATRAATRGKKAMDTIVEKTPLSPKKVTQIAKSTASSDDGISDMPSKKFPKSPARPAVERPVTPESPLSRSPVRGKLADHETSALLISPAKRPPPSPFKDALSQSPRKFPIPTIMPDLLVEGTDTVKEPLKQSPKKFDFTPLRPQGQAGQTKTKAGDMARAALLGSPARRPTSPMKFGSVRMPEKIGAPHALANTTSIMRHIKDSTLFSATPRRLFGNAAKTTNTSSPTKEPKIVPDENVELAITVQDPTISEEHLPTPYGFRKYSRPVQFGTPGEIFERDAFEESGQYRSLDNASEDELSLGPLTSSPRKTSHTRRLASSPSAVTPKTPAMSIATRKPRAKDVSMTPLAVQLSGWLADSPTRSESGTGEGASTEVYTPVAEILHHRERRRSTMTPAVARTTYFEDQLPEVNVTATPEEALQNQDLHSDCDVEMTDDVLSASTEFVVVAAPEVEGATIVDVEMTELDGVSMIEESFQAVPPTPAAPLEQILTNTSPMGQSFESDMPDTAHATNDDATEIDNTVDIGVEDSMEADESTVIITRPDTIPVAEFSEDEVVIETPIEADLVPMQQVPAEKLPLELESIFVSQTSTENLDEAFGDENVAPTVSTHVAAESTSGVEEACKTPVRSLRPRAQELHTIARVPLKPAASNTPVRSKLRKGRSKSMSAPLAELDMSDDLLITKKEEPISGESVPQTPVKTPRSISQPVPVMMTPGDDLISQAGSPSKSVRKGSDAQILRGAVVHVDVHTSEGADASGIFIELLTQMGARCIKQWNWNSRLTIGSAEDLQAHNKPGITHVIFKDGSKRTLQKAREAKGLVLCVGVGWVLDCERANRWLDEAAYAVDTSTIPRGGHNRRKSMEPKMLANHEGSLVEARTPAKPTRKSVRLSKARESIAPDVDETVLLPFTPGHDSTLNGVDAPATPDLSGPDSKLLQQTCPPKKTQRSLFPLSGNIDDQPDGDAREKLAKARRKTMQFAPKIGSPLGQDFAKEF